MNKTVTKISPHGQAIAKRAHSITFVLQLADVSIDRLLHHGKARWLNCPDEVIRSGTLKKYPVSPKIGKKMTPGTMHLFGKYITNKDWTCDTYGILYY